MVFVTKEGRVLRRCGYAVDCPRNYTLHEINVSAAEWRPWDREAGTRLQRARMQARDACARRQGIASGGWCLDTRKLDAVELPNNESYFVPTHHAKADGMLVAALLALLTRRLPTAGGAHGPWLSLLDFGAGVGQIGHALRSIEPRLRYRGYDGAGNVEAFTGGFVAFTDLTIPLALPRADWVSAFEVGEHVPSRDEATFVRNLHAHNCRGVVLSWAQLNQWGKGHVNNHKHTYVRAIFEGLGYRYAPEIALAIREGLRNGTGVGAASGHPALVERYFWFRRPTVLAFERTTRLDGPGCTSP